MDNKPASLFIEITIDGRTNWNVTYFRWQRTCVCTFYSIIIKRLFQCLSHFQGNTVFHKLINYFQFWWSFTLFFSTYCVYMVFQRILFSNLSFFFKVSLTPYCGMSENKWYTMTANKGLNSNEEIKLKMSISMDKPSNVKKSG